MINFILNNILFLGIKFRETKQIVVTFVATALKARLSGSKNAKIRHTSFEICRILTKRSS